MNPTCGCGTSPFLAGSAIPPEYAPLEGSASPTFTASGIMVVDDNWTPRVITRDGIPVTRNGKTRVTDGSNANGPIDLNPEVARAIDSFIGLLGNRIVKFGEHPKNDTPIPDGSTIMMQGQQWSVIPLSQLNRTFDPATLRTGGRQLLSFSCSSGQNVEFGLFQQTPNTVIYIDEKGMAQSFPLTEFASKLLSPLCSSAPIATEDDVISSILGCSQNGLVKTVTGLSKSYFHEPMVRLYWQGKYTGAGIIPVSNEISYYPELPALSVGTFNDEFIDIDLTTQPGYSEEATSILMSAQAAIGITAQPNTQQWALVVIVKGRERIRITAGINVGIWNSDVTQFMVAIPEDKKIRIQVARQITQGTDIAEYAYAAVYLEAFLLS